MGIWFRQAVTTIRGSKLKLGRRSGQVLVVSRGSPRVLSDFGPSSGICASSGGPGPDFPQDRLAVRGRTFLRIIWRSRRAAAFGRRLTVRARTVVWRSRRAAAAFGVVWRAGAVSYIGRLAEPAGRLERIV